MAGGVGVGVGSSLTGASRITRFPSNRPVPTPLRALIEMSLVPAVVGVPEIVAVPGSKRNPSGSGVDGSSATVGAGTPPTVKVYAYATPTVPSGGVPVIEPGIPTLIRSDAADGGLSPPALSAVTVNV